MITKETISTYCVDSKGDKDLAEAIAKQFERAGFEFYCSDSNDALDLVGGYCNHIGVTLWANSVICSFHYGGCAKPKITTLEHLTSMVDELLGFDEYAIVREFINMMEEFRHYTPNRKENVIERFKSFRLCNPTLDELKAEYAKSKGIEVDKIVVRKE